MSTYKQPNAEHNQGIKISVITVCKNSEAHIEKAIQSVINQTYKNIEYIIIDGDSQDKTKDIIQKYSKYIDKFISEPDTGIYNAMNKGIKLATGFFIQFLNSDDYFYDNNVVEDVVQFIRQNPDCDIVYGDAEIRPDPRMGGEPFIAKSPLPSDIPESLIVGHFFFQGSIFFNHNCFNKLGTFDEEYRIASDYKFYTHFLSSKYNLKMDYCPKTIFSFLASGISATDPKLCWREMFDIQNQLEFFQEKNWQEKRTLKLQEKIIKLNQALHENSLAHQAQRDFIAKLNNPWFAFKMAVRSFLIKYFRLQKQQF